MFDFRRADGEVYQIKPLLTFSLMSQPDVFNEYLKNIPIPPEPVDFFLDFYLHGVKAPLAPVTGMLIFQHRAGAEYFYDRVNELLRQNKVRLNDNTYTPKKH